MTIKFVEEHFHCPSSEAELEAMMQCAMAYQRANCPVYRQFSRTHRYLPVAAFKHGPVTTFSAQDAESVFESSSTGRGAPSRHWVRRLAVYERAVSVHFEHIFGAGPFTILAHLPRYARASSLVHMMHLLIGRYGDAASGFFLDNTDALKRAMARERPLLLFGAAFGLLDLVERRAWPLPEGSRVIETGGMKTYRRQMARAELHRRLAQGFAIGEAQIWSEYGMCELMSQAYARGGGVYYPPAWMHFQVLDPHSLHEREEDVPGVLAVFDLANLHSACALLTEDLAVRRGEGFEILGRVSPSELRGCNFLFEGT